MKSLRITFALLLVLSFGEALHVKAAAWVYLGEAHVDGEADHDKISVGSLEGRYRAIKIRVERAPIDFQRVVVHYGDGENEEIAIAYRINAGHETRVIELRGRERIIKSVEFWYSKARYYSDRPRVRLFGLRTA